MSEPPQDNSLAAEKVKSFPHTPGVYLMKDAAGRVIYVGKARNLKARVQNVEIFAQPANRVCEV